MGTMEEGECRVLSKALCRHPTEPGAETTTEAGVDGGRSCALVPYSRCGACDSRRRSAGATQLGRVAHAGWCVAAISRDRRRALDARDTEQPVLLHRAAATHRAVSPRDLVDLSGAGRRQDDVLPIDKTQFERA